MSLKILHRPTADTQYRVAGWPLGSEGRKHFAAAALYDEDGRPVALAKAIWIELRKGITGDA